MRRGKGRNEKKNGMRKLNSSGVENVNCLCFAFNFLIAVCTLDIYLSLSHSLCFCTLSQHVQKRGLMGTENAEYCVFIFFSKVYILYIIGLMEQCFQQRATPDNTKEWKMSKWQQYNDCRSERKTTNIITKNMTSNR